MKPERLEYKNTPEYRKALSEGVTKWWAKRKAEAA